MDISYEKFIGALQAIHDAAHSGDEMVAKFSYAVEKLMPNDLQNGRYKMLGGLLKSLASEYMPLTGSDYYSKEMDLNRLEQGIRDVLETVDYVLRKMASEEEGVEEIVRDTLMTLRPRIDKMGKLKSKFVGIAIRPALKEMVIKAGDLPKAIDEAIGKADAEGGKERRLDEEILELLANRDDALIPQLYRLHSGISETLEEHREKTSEEGIFKAYLKLLRLVMRRCDEAVNVKLEGISSFSKAFLEDGSLAKVHWDLFASKNKDNDDLKKSLESLVLLYSVDRRRMSDKEKLAQKFSFFNLCDWMEWSLSMSYGLPMMLTARRSLTLYRNLIVDMLKQRAELRVGIEKLEGSNEATLKLWDGLDAKMIEAVRQVKVSAYAKAFAASGVSVEVLTDSAEKLRIIHQLLFILEQEMLRVSVNIDRQLSESESGKDSFDDISSPTFQLETLLRRCVLGVQANSLQPEEYSPLACRWSDRISEEDIVKQLEKLKSIFPSFSLPLQSFSFKKPLTYKVKDFTSDFTPQNFASKIRDLRQEFTENSQPWGKLKILLLPGVGHGSYDDNSETLLVPSFRRSTDLDCMNFMYALADYLLNTREALPKESYEALLSKLKRVKTLPPQLTPRHRLQVLALSLRELVRLNESREMFAEIKDLLSPLFEQSVAQVSDSELDDAILELMEYRKA